MQTGRGFVPGLRGQESRPQALTVCGKFQGLVYWYCSGMSSLKSGASCRAGVSETEKSEQLVGDELYVGLALSQDPELRGSELAQSLRPGFALHPHPLWHLALSPSMLTGACLYFLSCDGDWPWARCHGQDKSHVF